MDELLYLFRADDTAEANETTTTNNDNSAHAPIPRQSLKRDGSTPSNVDFGSSFGNAFGNEITTNPSAGRRRGALSSSSANARVGTLSRAPTNASAEVAKQATTKPSKSCTTPCDPITGLRITDRRTSRADMIDAFSPFTYKSCSMLAAASRVEWTSYLISGGSSAGGTPNGKTNVVTCGILTTDTSSKLSKTGRAFAILNLGDLPSSMQSRTSSFGGGGIHACVSVFLFGDALRILSTNKNYLRAGYAVAILGANVMPPKNDGKGGGNITTTSVSLSVNDPRQILPIGKAVDCGRCSGTTRKRVDFSGNRWEDVRCGTLIDLRLEGCYCKTHRNQGLSSKWSSGKTTKSKPSNNGTTFIKNQRMESYSCKGVGIVGLQQANGGLKHSGGISFQQGVRHGGAAQAFTSDTLSQAGFLGNPSTNAHPGLTGIGLGHVTTAQQSLKRAPMHMKKAATPNLASHVSSASNMDSSKKNPYSKKTAHSTTKRAPTSQLPNTSEDDILGEALQKKRSKTDVLLASKKSKFSSETQSTNKRPTKVFHTEGYDGSVQVPQPSSVLFKKNATTYTASVTPSPSANRLSTNEAQRILEKQQSLAALLKEPRREPRAVTNACRNNYATHKRAAAKKNDDDIFASFFNETNDGSPTKSFDRDAVLNAKSRFAEASNAEEYARARSVVHQLEVREIEIDQRRERMERTKQGVGSNKDKSKAAAGIVTTGWVCKTCKTKSLVKPLGCFRAKHDVRQRRELKEAKLTLGTRKERINRHGKDADEGGLTLGAGLEWSGWRGGGDGD